MVGGLADSACVRPLFKHMFIPSVGPSLAICGLPWRCAKFPQFQLQGQLLARLLSGAVTLPSQQEMEQVGDGVLLAGVRELRGAAPDMPKLA